MATVAEPKDIVSALRRPLTTAEAQYVGEMLARIERRIKRKLPDLGGDDDELRGLIGDVEAEAVARVLRNPEGFMSESDGTYAYQVNRMVASGLLTVTDEEWGMLGVDLDPVQSVRPATDAYLATRRGTHVDWQHDWPIVGDQLADTWPG